MNSLHWVALKSKLRKPLKSRRTSKILTCLYHGNSKILDGRSLASTLKKQVKIQIEERSKRGLRVPGLGVIHVGSRKDSIAFVRMKEKACNEVGMNVEVINYPDIVDQSVLLNQVELWNNNPHIHGIIVQVPLPSHLCSERLQMSVSPLKDVDGLHPLNSVYQTNREIFVPCAAKACMEFLHHNGVDLCGKKAVVVGRSKLVGLPVAMLLLRHSATVTICHHNTVGIEEEVNKGDIVVLACGQPKMVKKHWIKPGAVVLDAGEGFLEDNSSKSGFRVCGDADFDDVLPIVSKISPVPGGIGPVTVAVLLQNTLQSAQAFDVYSK